MNDKTDRAFSALANPIRRSIVHELSLQPRSITRLAVSHKLSLPAIHKHIVQLEDAGLVLRRKSGRVNYLSINRHGLQLATGWLQQFNTHWGSNNETLENYIKQIEKE